MQQCPNPAPKFCFPILHKDPVAYAWAGSLLAELIVAHSQALSTKKITASAPSLTRVKTFTSTTERENHEPIDFIELGTACKPLILHGLMGFNRPYQTFVKNMVDISDQHATLALASKEHMICFTALRAK